MRASRFNAEAGEDRKFKPRQAQDHGKILKRSIHVNLLVTGKRVS
jgi:hypothetical protein